MIPRIAHFVFGLEEQREPFHFLHYLAIESCRQVIDPEAIYFHHKHLPWGPWWERIRPHLTLSATDRVAAVDEADYSAGHVPIAFRYTHHADFVRLDALIDHGGIYADIDTIFVRPFPDELLAGAPFVIGREPDVRDEQTGVRRASLCNALLMSEPNAAFARAWRDAMPRALNGTWSNHTGFLSERLTRLMPEAVRVEQERTFFPFPATRAGIAALLEERHAVPVGALSIHLWAHLWWERGRNDYTGVHSGSVTPEALTRGQSTIAELARPYLRSRKGAAPATGPRRESDAPTERWRYLSLADRTGYAHAAHRYMSALEESGLELVWTPFVHGNSWGLGYQPAPPVAGGAPDPFSAAGHDRAAERGPDSVAHDDEPPVVVAHLVAEYLPRIREIRRDAFLVAQTVWETDRLPERWIACLNQADLISVPSRFSTIALSATEVRAPVAVVPHAAPPITAGRAESWAWIPDDVLVFYVIGDWHPRKGIDKTVEAYLRAFRSHERVLLIVKTTQEDPRMRWSSVADVAHMRTSAFALARLLARHPDAAPVHLVTRPLSDAEIAGLHTRGDCFVSLCRSEGWGLGAFDAAAYGNPVVITGFGGQLDYLGDSPYLVGYGLVPVEDPVHPPGSPPGDRWAEPDVNHGAALLRKLAADLDAARNAARDRAHHLRHRYRPSAIAAALRSAVEEHHAARAPRHREAVASANRRLSR